MKRWITFTFALLLGVMITSPFTNFCASEEPQKPEKVYSVIYVQKPNDWYIKQAELWKKKIDKNPKDNEAWHNYYNAVRYARFTETIETKEKKKKLNQIIAEMGKVIPGSFEYHYLKHKTNCDLWDIEDLKKAYEIQPDRHETYSDFISYYEFHGDMEKMKEFSEKLYLSKDLAPALINYNYNVLMSTDQKAILFTNGDNDTYPVWVLQQVKGIRNDVTVLNASISMADKSYLIRKLKAKNVEVNFDDLPQYRTKEFITALGKYIAEEYPNIPVYYAATMWSYYIDPLRENLYMTGLANKYSSQRIDNIALIKRNLETRFRLDYLIHDWYEDSFLATDQMYRLNMNYVPSMIMLAEHYKISNESIKSNYWKDFAIQLAERAGMKEKIIQDLKEKGL